LISLAVWSTVVFVVTCFVFNRVVAACRRCGRVQWREHHSHRGRRENVVLHLILYTQFIISFFCFIIIIISTRGRPA
jgi:hypothetical protein